MSFIGKAWQYVKHWWNGIDGKHGVCIDQYPKEKVLIGIGGSTKLSANVTTSSPESFIKWHKVEGNKSINLRTDSIKYSGSSCSMPIPELVIHDVDKTDDGVYHLSVTTVTGIVTGPKVLLNVFGDPVISLPKEERNFLRYYLLCQTIATESVRLYFTRKVPEPTLSTHLNTHKSNLQFSYWKCTNDQLTILFPAAPGNAKSRNFDFSLLYKLIRNTITPPSTPTRGWGSKPLPGDIKEEDDIERIRQNRNLLAHNTEFKLNDSDFNDLWTDLSQAIVRLSFGSMSVDVIKLSKQKLDQQLKNEIFENLKIVIEIMKGEINILHQDMEECKERIQTIEDNHIPPHIRETQTKLLKEWKKDDELFYDATNVYQATKDKVESCSIVALVGGPGCGKTATARHIAIQYEQNGWEIVPVFRIENILQYTDVTFKQIFLLDDIFGIFAVDMFMYNNVKNHKEGIMNAISKDSKLILTCRRSVYHETEKLKPFVFKNIVDLEGEDNKLNDVEKENILTKHCRNKGVPENSYDSVSLSSSNIMFPLLCKVFSTKHALHGSADIFFEQPLDCLISELDQLEYICPEQYVALVLCVLSNNLLSLKNMPGDKMKLDGLNTCGVNLGTSDKQIKNALSNLVGTYLIKHDHDVTFIHDAIYEIVAFHYGQNCPHILLKYMKSNFIATKLKVFKDHTAALCTDLSILIQTDYYELLAERLYTDLQSFELFDVFMNKSLLYPPFLEVFVKILRNKPYYDLKALLFTENNASNVINRYSDKEEEGDDGNEDEGKLDLLRNVHFDILWKGTNSIRAISWILYYGHTYLLQNIINLALEHNDSSDIVFKSDITEQTRLLTLGCYSGDPDMVNTILKYVQVDCVNKTSYKENMLTSHNGHRKYTPLTAACYDGHLSVVQVLLIKNAKIEQYDDNFRFPLLAASLKGHDDIVKFLIQKGVDVNQCNEDNESPLYSASQEGHHEVVKHLVENGADVNQSNNYDKSPLYAASSGGHYDVVQYLVQNGVDVNGCGKDNPSPLMGASLEGYIDIVKYLVQNRADVNQGSENNPSPLYGASQEGNTTIVKYLVENGACVNLCSIFNQSALYGASNEGHYDIVDYLVQNGADVNLCNKYNHSPLFKASGGGHCNIVEYLVQNGANINQCDNINSSPLYQASVKGHTSVVEYLVQNGADVNLSDHMNRAPLYGSSEEGHIDIVKYLVQNGADINQCVKYYQSPLSRASANGHYDVVKYLVLNGANINFCDYMNKTPLFHAVDIGHSEIVKFLITNNADFTIRNDENMSPLEFAVLINCSEIAKELIRAENQNIPFSGNYHLFDILVDIRKTDVCIYYRSDDGGVITKKKLHFLENLFKCLERRSIECLKHLLQLGLDANKKCDERGQSPFNRIIESNMEDIDKKVELLIKNGTDLTVRDSHCVSALEKSRRLIIEKKQEGLGLKWPFCCEIYENLMEMLKQHTRRYSI